MTRFTGRKGNRGSQKALNTCRGMMLRAPTGSEMATIKFVIPAPTFSIAGMTLPSCFSPSTKETISVFRASASLAFRASSRVLISASRVFSFSENSKPAASLAFFAAASSRDLTSASLKVLVSPPFSWSSGISSIALAKIPFKRSLNPILFPPFNFAGVFSPASNS